MHTHEFSLDKNIFPLTLTPGEEKNINLYFYPYDATSRVVNDVLTINSDINSDTLVQRVAVQVRLTGISTYTSVKEIRAGELSVYPNPATDAVTIHSPGEIDGTIMLFSTDGKLVYKSEMHAHQYTINIGSLNNGIYILEIHDRHSGKSYRKRIIKF